MNGLIPDANFLETSLAKGAPPVRQDVGLLCKHSVHFEKVEMQKKESQNRKKDAV